jgi:hypothetical protein
MGTANYDASRVTQRKRSAVLYTSYAANNAAVANGTSIRREQPDTQLNEIVAYRNTSKAFFTPTNECACSQDVTVNAGGNANNVQ